MQLDVRQPDELRAGSLGKLEAFPLRARLDVRAADGVVELHVGPYAVVDLLSVFDVGAESAGGYDNRFRVHGDLLASAVHGRQTSDGAVF